MTVPELGCFLNSEPAALQIYAQQTHGHTSTYTVLCYTIIHTLTKQQFLLPRPFPRLRIGIVDAGRLSVLPAGQSQLLRLLSLSPTWQVAVWPLDGLAGRRCCCRRRRRRRRRRRPSVLFLGEHSLIQFNAMQCNAMQFSSTPLKPELFKSFDSAKASRLARLG